MTSAVVSELNSTCRSSSPRCAVFTGTATAPIRASAKISGTKSGQFGSITATWSPLPTPSAISPCASRLAWPCRRRRR